MTAKRKAAVRRTKLLTFRLPSEHRAFIQRAAAIAGESESSVYRVILGLELARLEVAGVLRAQPKVGKHNG